MPPKSLFSPYIVWNFVWPSLKTESQLTPVGYSSVLLKELKFGEKITNLLQVKGGAYKILHRCNDGSEAG